FNSDESGIPVGWHRDPATITDRAKGPSHAAPRTPYPVAAAEDVRVAFESVGRGMTGSQPVAGHDLTHFPCGASRICPRRQSLCGVAA
ncbi:MAG: hypothetical protein KDA96_17390, partial [Planctomycetaceae bacterium]|nr:hypothetical protein [Planctomycetaceae bacterium]